jgi:hypothetical protein
MTVGSAKSSTRQTLPDEALTLRRSKSRRPASSRDRTLYTDCGVCIAELQYMRLPNHLVSNIRIGEGGSALGPQAGDLHPMPAPPRQQLRAHLIRTLRVINRRRRGGGAGRR